MQQESSSIFDKDFIAETWIRRKELMSLGLKIYVWFYVITSAFIALAFGYLVIKSDILLYQLITYDNILENMELLSPVLLFLSGFFLLLEKKWAILFAVIAVVILILYGGYSLFMVLKSGAPITREMGNIFKLLLKVPYVVLLLKIKHDWETKAVSGKELRENNKNS